MTHMRAYFQKALLQGKDEKARALMGLFFSHLIPKELDYLVNGVQQPYVNPFKAVS